MKYLTGSDKKDALRYIEEASKIALNSTCLRSKCGAVIVKERKIIGEGFNSPHLIWNLREDVQRVKII